MSYNQFAELEKKINLAKTTNIYGRVVSVKGLAIEVDGIVDVAAIGSQCVIETEDNHKIMAEVVGFNREIAILLPFAPLDGINIEAKVRLKDKQFMIYPSLKWKGRILNANAEAMDKLGLLPHGDKPYKLKNSPPPANLRQRVINKIDLGIRSINSFLTCCRGQRMGIFAGSGVGKSVLISMIARFAAADVKVIGLIGERGRELTEFINEYVGEEGLKNCVIVVATNDEPAIIRRQATYLTITIAEYFRDQGMEVVCILDSITRFAMAQREIGLATGEPPTSKGYTPTVFSELAQVLERAGPGLINSGNISALFNVLVEGDDMNEPIADAVRGILDGHIVLDRALAERGILPAVNILKSISRTMPQCNTEQETKLISKARKIISTYTSMEEMIRLGIYKKGTDPEIDTAIELYPKLAEFITQNPKEHDNFEECYKKLTEILNVNN